MSPANFERENKTMSVQFLNILTTLKCQLQYLCDQYDERTRCIHGDCMTLRDFELYDEMTNYMDRLDNLYEEIDTCTQYIIKKKVFNLTQYEKFKNLLNDVTLLNTEVKMRPWWSGNIHQHSDRIDDDDNDMNWMNNHRDNAELDYDDLNDHNDWFHVNAY